MKSLAFTVALLAGAGGMMPLPPPVVAPSASAPSSPAAAPSPQAAPSPDATPSPEAASPPASPATTPPDSPDEPESADASPATTAPARTRPKMAPGFAPRGAIRDRTGKALISDGPCWDVSVRYEVVAGLAGGKGAALAKAYLGKVALARAKGPGGAEGPSPERLATMLAKQVQGAWADISEVAGVEPGELEKRAQRAVAQVERMKAAVARTHGDGRQIAEEKAFRVMARVFGAEAGRDLAKRLDQQPWVKLTASQSRISAATPSIVHVLGRVGKADAKRASTDPLATDPNRALQAGDTCGISGVERLGDALLRPWFEADGTVHAGQDVTLTIDAALQNDVYRILERAVKKSMNPCGGAAVVIDVATGEVRALVSYPAHAYDLSISDSQKLADDTRWTPMRFRAVSSQFPPGSTIKPVTLYTSLAKGVVTRETEVQCAKGGFYKEMPNAFRCWVFNRTGGSHGVENGEEALRDSCNIYFFTAGDKLGAAPLIQQFQALGLGQSQGTGLIEESPGILPTPEWLATHRKNGKNYGRADAWNYAFGQGEFTVTPIQMANLAATLARGRFEQVTLMRDAKGQRIGVDRAPGARLEEKWLTTVRKGLWRVVNEKGGTADVAKLDRPDAVLVGKTGSAQAVSRVIARRFTFKLPDGQTEEIDAPTVERARTQVPAGAKLVSQTVQERYPETEDDVLPSHAWFIGYTQAPDTLKGAAPAGTSYALSVLVEYGGAGGAVASPIARDIARRIYGGPSTAPPEDEPEEKPKPEKSVKKKAKKKPEPEPEPVEEEAEE